MTESLKPCPFCGVDPRTTGNPTRDLAKCGTPKCPGSQGWVSFEAWQTRAPTPEGEALRGLVEAMDLCLGLGWREDTLHQKAQGDAVNRAWDAVIACIQLPAEEGENG